MSHQVQGGDYSQRENESRDLRERIAAGEDEPRLFTRLAKLLEPEAGLELLRDASRRLSSLPLYYAYIDTLEACNRSEEAVLVAAEASRLFPDESLLRIKEGLILPVLYDDTDQIRRWRDRFSRKLAELDSAGISPTSDRRAADVEALSYHTNFYLAYQAENDRELQHKYAELVYRRLEATYGDCLAPVPTRPTPRKSRIRLGYRSARYRHHSVSKSHNEWILSRTRKRFEVFAYQVGSSADSRTDEVRQASDHYRQVSGDFPTLCEAIRSDQLDAAVFLDVGMEPVMTLLASARLAPVQCVTWGHPVTTGSPNMDFFLSSSLMEPSDGEDCYTERLVRLPGIGSCYRKPLIPNAVLDTNRGRFGLRSDARVYLCCQSTFKYLPCHDDLYARIAERVPNSQFVFLVGNPCWLEGFRRRLRQAFAAINLSAEAHCVFLPSLKPFDYWALNLTADVYLDTPDWNGSNSTMEAIAGGNAAGKVYEGPPWIRDTTQLGTVETIARDKGEYVDIAVKLGTDADWRGDLIRRMADRHSLIYSDTRSVRALEDFLEKAVELSRH
jgi:protein O-GlcNAc transferase